MKTAEMNNIEELVDFGNTSGCYNVELNLQQEDEITFCVLVSPLNPLLMFLAKAVDLCFFLMTD